MLRDRGALPKEEGDVIGEYKAMHEENCLSSWLREDGKEKEEKLRKQARRPKKRGAKKRRREEEEEENETGSVKRSCVGFVSVEAFDIFSQGRDLESCGGLSWKDLLEKREGWSGLEPETRWVCWLCLM